MTASILPEEHLPGSIVNLSIASVRCGNRFP